MESNDLNGKWIKIERDSSGYLVYEPCDKGSKWSVEIIKDEIIYDLSQETPDTLTLLDLNILTPKNQFEIIGQNMYYTMTSVITIIDLEKRLYLLKWRLSPHNDQIQPRTGKMMMTKKENESDFRLIENNCDSVKIMEQEFLPILYD